MSTPETPADPQELRGEIAQTRADLGETVEALAAKTKVKARAKQTAGDVADQAKQKVAAATGRAAQAVGELTETAVSAKERLEDQVPPTMRRPLPWAAFAAAAALVGGVIVLVRRRRS